MTIKSIVKLIGKYELIQITEKDIDKSCKNFDDDDCPWVECSECDKYEPRNESIRTKLFTGEFKNMPFVYLDREIVEIGITTIKPHNKRSYTRSIIEIFVKGENFK